MSNIWSLISGVLWAEEVLIGITLRLRLKKETHNTKFIKVMTNSESFYVLMLERICQTRPTRPIPIWFISANTRGMQWLVSAASTGGRFTGSFGKHLWNREAIKFLRAWNLYHPMCGEGDVVTLQTDWLPTRRVICASKPWKKAAC